MKAFLAGPALACARLFDSLLGGGLSYQRMMLLGFIKRVTPAKGLRPDLPAKYQWYMSSAIWLDCYWKPPSLFIT